MGSSTSTAKVTEAAIVNATGSDRQKMLSDLAKKHKDVDGQDFYELFGLPRYADVKEERHEAQLRKEFRVLILRWHPDKNPASKKEECDMWTSKICLAKRVLEDPDLKRRYDLELRKLHNESTGWSSFGWFAAWGWNVASMAGGLGMMVAAACAAPWTAGASLSVTTAGSALFVSGLKGSIKMGQDPDCSTTEFVKDSVVGALQGAAGGVIGAAGGAAMSGLSVGGQVGIAAGCGAGTAVAGQVISDSTDVCITDGLLGKHVKDNVTNAKTREEVFSAQNAGKMVRGAVIGAAIGAVVQGVAVAGSGQQPSDIAEVADEAAVALRTSEGSAALSTAAARVKDRVKGMGGMVKDVSQNVAKNGAAKQAIGTTLKTAAPKITKVLSSQIAFQVHDAVETLFERIRKLSPHVAHRLVDDAAEANFMLSRTNLQKDFADKTVVSLLEEGWKLCADNSLKDGWGGPGWVEKYVKDSQKTDYGILVLEGGSGFFQSTPCCDELFAAKKAGVNLTRVSGTSIHKGEYLWVEITEQLFTDETSYEQTMRRKHADQYTPIWYNATMGKFYDPRKDGVQYTYYCIVPKGRAAKATGADAQSFP